MVNTPSYVTPKMELHDLIERNSRLLLLMEHFGTGFTVADMNIVQFCGQHGINPELFASFCNLYNGDTSNLYVPKGADDVAQIITFLENSHRYYLDEMYPEIKFYIHKLSEINNTEHVSMLETFFESYMKEVTKHLEWEQNEIFPLLRSVCNGQMSVQDFCSKAQCDKLDSHADIGIKLRDLKNLLLKYIKLVDRNGYKRKLLAAIFEFQFDLDIHSIIEDKILMKAIKGK